MVEVCRLGLESVCPRTPCRLHHFPRRHSLLEFRLAGRSTVTPMHRLLLGFWVNLCNPNFITCDDTAKNSLPSSWYRCRNAHSDFMSFALCSSQLLCSVHSKLYQTPHFTVGGSWNKSHKLQPLQRCYCENPVIPASACVRQYHYSITYTQFLHAINGLQVVGRLGNYFVDAPRIV